MANQWFRMYSEFASDAKVQMMPETYQRRLLMLMCLRCNGDVTLHDAEIAFQLRIGDVEWGETKRDFIARGFIDSDNNLLNWDKRQYASDSSVARVKRHREAKRNAHVTECNVTVTPPEQSRTDTEQIQNRAVSCAHDDQPSEGEHEATAYIRAFDESGRKAYGAQWMRLYPAKTDFSAGCQLHASGANVDDYRRFVGFRMSEMAAANKSPPKSMLFFAEAWTEHVNGLAGVVSVVSETEGKRAEREARAAKMEAIRQQKRGIV